MSWPEIGAIATKDQALPFFGEILKRNDLEMELFLQSPATWPFLGDPALLLGKWATHVANRKHQTQKEMSHKFSLLPPTKKERL